MRDHKSLFAWQEAHEVVRIVLPAIREPEHRSSQATFDQLRRAALSVQLNIAEGYALKSPKRFRNHLDIAYASAVETTELLELSGALGLLSPRLVGSAVQRCRRCQGLLLGLIKHLRKV